jgi:hypothetical protein
MHQYWGRPERVLRDQADGLRRAPADGTPAAIAAAVARIPDEDAAAPDQLRELMAPSVHSLRPVLSLSELTPRRSTSAVETQ